MLVRARSALQCIARGAGNTVQQGKRVPGAAQQAQQAQQGCAHLRVVLHAVAVREEPPLRVAAGVGVTPDDRKP